MYIPMRAAERYQRRIRYAFSAHCATSDVDMCLELLVRRFDEAHDARPEDLDDSVSAHVDVAKRVAAKKHCDSDEEPLVGSFLFGTVNQISKLEKSIRCFAYSYKYCTQRICSYSAYAYTHHMYTYCLRVL